MKIGRLINTTGKGFLRDYTSHMLRHVSMEHQRATEKIKVDEKENLLNVWV